MVKAIFLVHALADGGAERVISRLLAALAEGSSPGTYRLAVFEPRITYPVPPGVVVHVLARGSRSLLGKLVTQVEAFVRFLLLVRRERPEAVISFMPRSNSINLAGKSSLRGWPRAIVSERVAVGQNYRGLVRLLVRGAVRRLYARADKVVAVSAGVAEELEALGVPRDRIAVIANPVAVEELERQAASGVPHAWTGLADPVLVSVGRLSRQKGYTVLLRALEQLRKRRAVRLVVFGQGPERIALEAEAAGLGVADAVAWAGFEPNPFPTVAKATVFVLPSLWEGFPNALLEAMALGRPVVASDCPWGPRELLEGGRYGVLVPPGDAGALAEAIDRFLHDGRLRREYGERARLRAMQYALPAIAARYAAVLEGRE